MLRAKWPYLPLGGSLRWSRRDDTLPDAPHMIAHLHHRRGVADVQRDFDAAKGEAEEIAASVVTDRIERTFRVKSLGHIRFGVQDGLDTMGRPCDDLRVRVYDGAAARVQDGAFLEEAECCHLRGEITFPQEASNADDPHPPLVGDLAHGGKPPL